MAGRILYTWIGGTRRDWRGQGHFRALTEQQEAWAIENGFDEIIVKTKNRFYEMRATLDHLRFDVVKYEQHPDNQESKVYLGKKLGPELLDTHRSHAHGGHGGDRRTGCTSLADRCTSAGVPGTLGDATVKFYLASSCLAARHSIVHGKEAQTFDSSISTARRPMPRAATGTGPATARSRCTRRRNRAT